MYYRIMLHVILILFNDITVTSENSSAFGVKLFTTQLAEAFCVKLSLFYGYIDGYK